MYARSIQPISFAGLKTQPHRIVFTKCNNFTGDHSNDFQDRDKIPHLLQATEHINRALSRHRHHEISSLSFHSFIPVLDSVSNVSTDLSLGNLSCDFLIFETRKRSSFTVHSFDRKRINVDPHLRSTYEHSDTHEQSCVASKPLGNNSILRRA